jgi:hypothetical protein
MWFDRQTYLQRMYTDLEKLIEDCGWEKTLFYRINNGTKFIDVRLFESLGTDGEYRRFGIAAAYDTNEVISSDARHVPADSPIGKIGVGNGTKTVFDLPAYPVVLGSVEVYKNSTPMNSSEYSIDNSTGKITFTTAPAMNDVLTMEYQLGPTAPEPNNEMILFTFNKYNILGEVKLTDSSSQIGMGDGTTTTFNTLHDNIDELSLKVYVDGVLVPVTDYTVDSVNGVITFGTAPAAGKPVKVEYKYYEQPDANKTIPTITTTKVIDVHNSGSIMDAVYGEKRVDYILPSPYTVVSFTPDNKFTNEWKRDSIMYMYGNGNRDRIAMFMRIDPSGNPVKALFVPIYIGRLQIVAGVSKPRKNMVILSGCRSGNEFIWSKDKKVGDKLLDYGDNTSNGNKTVQLAQNYSGAMYQHHYLAFITHDKMFDPMDEGRFNPSVYSGKYHLSRMYIVHPNDGYVGALDDIYAVHPKNIQQADELEITKTVQNEEIGVGDGVNRVFYLYNKPKDGTLTIKVNCVTVPDTEYTLDPETKAITFNTPPVGEILADYEFEQLYRYSLPTTPVSPMTQDIATPYNPIGWAIYKEDI